jgi:hypothetical protein
MEEILNDGWNLRGKNYTMEEELHDGWKLRRKVEELKLQNAWKTKGKLKMDEMLEKVME